MFCKQIIQIQHILYTKYSCSCNLGAAPARHRHRSVGTGTGRSAPAQIFQHWHKHQPAPTGTKPAQGWYEYWFITAPTGTYSSTRLIRTRTGPRKKFELTDVRIKRAYTVKPCSKLHAPNARLRV